MTKKSGFFDRAIKVINSSDIVLEVMDARFPKETRNERIEAMVKEKGKELILVLNKSDLVNFKDLRKTKKSLKGFPVVFVSVKKRKGIKRLREEIGKKSKGKNVRIGVIGYPNTGKSSLINALSGKKVGVSASAGFTRGEKFIKGSKKFLFIDSPGVIPFNERDELLLGLLGAKSPERINNVEGVAEKIIELLKQKNAKRLAREFGVGIEKSAEDILKEIALKKKKLLSGSRPDTVTVSKQIIKKFQEGKLNFK